MGAVPDFHNLELGGAFLSSNLGAVPDSASPGKVCAILCVLPDPLSRIMARAQRAPRRLVLDSHLSGPPCRKPALGHVSLVLCPLAGPIGSTNDRGRRIVIFGVCRFS